MLRRNKHMKLAYQYWLQSITGLGKYVSGGSKNFKATLSANGKSVANQGGDKGFSWTVPRASEKKSLVVNLDKADEGKVFLILTSEGIKTNPEFKTGGEGLALSRIYRKQDGSPLDPEAEVALGEVIFTENSGWPMRPWASTAAKPPCSDMASRL